MSGENYNMKDFQEGSSRPSHPRRDHIDIKDI